MGKALGGSRPSQAGLDYGVRALAIARDIGERASMLEQLNCRPTTAA